MLTKSNSWAKENRAQRNGIKLTYCDHYGMKNPFLESRSVADQNAIAGGSSSSDICVLHREFADDVGHGYFLYLFFPSVGIRCSGG